MNFYNNDQIILIKPDDGLGKKINPPLALLYVGGALKKAGYDVRIIHCADYEIDNAVDKVLQENPIFVGLSVITGPNTLYAADISKRIKNKKRDITIVWGGIHPSLLPEQCIKEEYIDIVVVGEGEETAVELANALKNNKSLDEVKGIFYKKNGRICSTGRRPFIKNLDNYRMDFELMDLRPYLRETQDGFKRAIGYTSSRGCPHSCNFCYNQAFSNRIWRAYSIDTVLEDIRYLKDTYNIDAVYFWDDNFYPNKKRAFEILGKIEIPAYTEIRIDYIDEKTAEKLRDTHCKMILVGAESGCDRILEFINKGFRVEDIKKSAELLSKYQIPTHYSFILGFPTEQPHETKQTIDLMRYIFMVHKEADFTINWYMPYPGSKLYEVAIDNGFEPPVRTEEWYTINSFYDKAKLPWIDTTKILDIREIFLYAKNGIVPIQKLFSLRIKHDFFAFPLDVRIYRWLVHNSFFTRERMKSMPVLGHLFKKWM